MKKKYHGYIDKSIEIDDDSFPVPKEGLTFMVVSVKARWKMLVGYFLIAGLGATERANLVKECLIKFHSSGVTVISLTCDGAASNMSMIKNQGCTFEYDTAESAFHHPVTEEQICVFLDPCHILKLEELFWRLKKSADRLEW